MADWDTVREIASRFPEVEESAPGSMPAFRMRGKLFAWMSPKPEAEGALVVRVDADEKPLLLASRPDLYFRTPHYESYPCVLVHLDRIERAELEERLEDAWLIRAPKRIAASFLEST